ncbi:MAG: TldD/PmbA family protein [candidate division WOR-3 bacterium]|nr:TldD/PmbA family protein [candidate division WOR-3 bacterium]
MQSAQVTGIDKDLVAVALNSAKMKGASYVDVRLIRKQEEEMMIKNGRVEVLKKDEDAGVGIRVIAQGCWGFAATAKLNKEDVAKTASLAVRVAKASSTLKAKDVFLDSKGKIIGEYKTTIIKDPFTVSLEDKMSLLLQVDEIMRKVKGVSLVESYLSFNKKFQIFAASDDSYIEQWIYQSGGFIAATAVKGNITGERSYPGMHGHYKTAGYEFIESQKFLENAQRVAEESVALTTARECPDVTTTVICDGSMTAIQIHETIGHPTELDRVLGTEVSLAGKSHLTIDKLYKFQMGSPIVNITADATIEGGLGSFGFDDEGVPAQKTYLIKDGIFNGYLTSRETAPVINQSSNGAMRADSWASIPLIRMTNINLLPGTWTLEDLIADTEDGIYLESAGSPSIDDMRLNYHISSEIGWLIKNGKKTEMVRRPSYSGISYEIWRNCDAICNENYWEVWGVPNCGKGDPMQTMTVGHGASPARFRNIRIGK